MRERQDELKADMYVGFTTKHSKNKEEVRFTFRHASYARITCAMRLYFEMINGYPYVLPESKNKRGFAISHVKTAQLRCSHPGVVKWFKEHGGGEYNFKFDYRYNAYGFEKVENEEPEEAPKNREIAIKTTIPAQMVQEVKEFVKRSPRIVTCAISETDYRLIEKIAAYSGCTDKEIISKIITQEIQKLRNTLSEKEA